MAAYPFTIQTLEPSGSYKVGPGCILSSKFEMTPESLLTIMMIKPALTQDFSLRCWISRYPAGTSIETIKPIVSFWHPDRVVMHSICLHTTEEGLTESNIQNYNLQTVPGTHYLNVLNLTNLSNLYSGTFTFEQK